VRLFPLLQAVLALLQHQPVPTLELPPLSAREKAALVVVSGLPAPRGVAAVIVRPGDTVSPFPRGALVLADQEGGLVKAFPALPPWRAASEYARASSAFAAGRETGAALRRVGVHVDLAPVLDVPPGLPAPTASPPRGPLGSRHFRAAAFGVAFARGLSAGGTAACVKHFPGLGTAPISTDEDPHVHARIGRGELAGFRAAIRAGAPCVMTSHALYAAFGGRRASISPGSYRLLRRLGFRGVAITDSLDFAGREPALPLARAAVRNGADLLLFTNGRDARRAIHALVPLARRGALDVHVARVLGLRRALGLRTP
jgi:beta-N-acetylhexosaminidase